MVERIQKLEAIGFCWRKINNANHIGSRNKSASDNTNQEDDVIAANCSSDDGGDGEATERPSSNQKSSKPSKSKSKEAMKQKSKTKQVTKANTNPPIKTTTDVVTVNDPLVNTSNQNVQTRIGGSATARMQLTSGQKI